MVCRSAVRSNCAAAATATAASINGVGHARAGAKLEEASPDMGWGAASTSASALPCRPAMTPPHNHAHKHKHARTHYRAHIHSDTHARRYTHARTHTRAHTPHTHTQRFSYRFL